MRNSDFILDCVHILYYKSHKINPNCGGRYIGSTINPITKKDKARKEKRKLNLYR